MKAQVSIRDIARMLLRGDIQTASFTAQEWVSLAHAVARSRWSRLSESRFAIRLDDGRWRVYDWHHHAPDEDGNVVSIRAVGWL